PGAAPRRTAEQATPRAAASAAAASADHPISLQEVLGQLVSGDVRFDSRAVPREILVAGVSVIAGLVAALLWLAGARRRPAYAAAREGAPRHPRIDWSQIDAPRVADDAPAAQPQPFRSAA
ncbi:MAG: hypothetical protein ACKOBP_04635, partial [Planctomycetia bacterium]